jgi:hypothetical protein
MARYAIVVNGKVDNITRSDSALAANWFPCDETVKIGDTWTAEGFAPSLNIAPVPARVTMRQARLALLNAGKLAAVDTAINALPSPEKEQLQIYWEYSTNIERNSPRVAAISAAIGLDNTAIDNLFIEANKL